MTAPRPGGRSLNLGNVVWSPLDDWINLFKKAGVEADSFGDVAEHAPVFTHRIAGIGSEFGTAGDRTGSVIAIHGKAHIAEVYCLSKIGGNMARFRCYPGEYQASRSMSVWPDRFGSTCGKRPVTFKNY